MESLYIPGLLLALFVLIFLSFKNWGMLPVSLVASIVVVVTNRMDLWPAFSKDYAVAMQGFVGANLILFFLGTVFGGFMGESGAAKSISMRLMQWLGKDRAILITVLAAAILSYGGVSLFVVVFSLYPISVVLFKEANISKFIFPACLFFGCATFTMVNLPGTPAIQNIIPSNYFGTNAYAAPVVGISSSIFLFIIGYAYLKWEARNLQKKGHYFEPGPNDNVDEMSLEDPNMPDWRIAVIPMAAVIVTIFVLRNTFVSMFGVIIALFVGIVLELALLRKNIRNPLKSLNISSTNAIGALLNTAAVVGFGGVVKGSAGFQSVVEYALSLDMNPLIAVGIAVNITAGVTGSSSGGLGIFCETLGQQYLAKFVEAGISPQVLHRISAIASSGLDSLPHSGATVTGIIAAGLNHKQAYRYVFGTNIVCTILGLIFAIIVASFGLV